jgi:cytoskeletal protein CcmA (bactofilin family)
MFLTKKINASALQLVIVISVIILILVFALISLIFLQKRIETKHQNFKEAVYTTQQYFKFIEKNKIPFGTTDSITVLSSENSQTTFKKKQWGIFELMSIRTEVNKESFQKTAIIGSVNSKKDALYLKENNQQLIVVGNTTITGNVSISKRGVNSGNIGGVSYNKKQFVFGEIKQSITELPVINNRIHFESFIAGFDKDTIDHFELKKGLIKQNSFKNKTLLFQTNGVLEIAQIELKGNFIIESDSIIRVYDSAKLNDVILIAPKVEIEKGFKGNLQIFATEKIDIKENCELEYPSAIVMLKNESAIKKHAPTINISDFSILKGVILNLNSVHQNIFTSQVSLGQKTKIFGEIYCLGNIGLGGEVFGSVYANSVIAKQNGSIYMNHLYNSVINSGALDKKYAGLSFLNNHKTVAKWLE